MIELISKRQEYNYKILSILKSYFPEMKNKFTDIEKCIESFPQQRFGQIICNYICPDYRNQNVNSITSSIMGSIFPGNPDPFFEESEVTFKRLTEK